MSIEEEVDRLKEISRLYAKTDAEKLEMKKNLYAKEKDLADKHYSKEIEDIEKLNKGRVDNTDFAGMIEKYKAFAEEIKILYADYPETMKEKLDEVNELIIEKMQEKADKIASIEQKSLEDSLAIRDKQVAYLKQFDGMTLGDGSIFKFGAAEEKEYVQKDLDDINKAIANFVAKVGEDTAKMTNEQKAQYDDLISKREEHLHEMLSLEREEIKERQNLLEKEANDRLKAIENLHKEIVAKEKERTKAITDEIKSRYSEEIKLAEEAANAEIKVYEDKIRAIDDLLKAEERQEADESYQDKINRLKATLEFETDASNKYELQKEIDKLTAENDKRKRKESLEDEKASYQEEINLIKENLSEQKKLLEEKRDAEISTHEEALEAYTTKLNDELNALKENNKLSLKSLKIILKSK